MKEQELVTGAQEEVKFARKELAKARAKLDEFEAETPNTFFEVDKKEHLALLKQKSQGQRSSTEGPSGRTGKVFISFS